MHQFLRRSLFPCLLLLGVSSCIVPVRSHRGHYSQGYSTPRPCRRGPAITLGALTVVAPPIQLHF